MRMLISDNQINPIAWEVSKVEDLQPQGVTYVTFKQDTFNPSKDNKELMLADYYSSSIMPVPIPDEKEEPKLKIKFSNSATVKVGGAYKIFTAISDDEFSSDDILWQIENLDESEYSSILSNKSIKIKISKNYKLIGKVFNLLLLYKGTKVDEVQVEVVSL